MAEERAIQKFTLTYGGLAHLLKAKGLVPGPGSPLGNRDVAARLEKAVPDGTGLPVQGPAAETLDAALKVLAAPGQELLLRFGGGRAPMATQAVCGRGEPQGEVFGILFDQKGADIYRYEGMAQTLEALVAKYASRNEAVVPNLLPPKLRVEEFLCLLQGVDLYRRAYYRSLLEHAPTHRPGFTPKEFVDGLTASVQSKDVRWLLPAFLALLPGLPTERIRTAGEDLEVLTEKGIVELLKDSQGNPRFAFTPEGRAMGMEFERSWNLCVGLAVSRIAEGREQVLFKGMLLPTAAANHLVELVEEDGKLLVNHQAFRYDQLQARLAEVLGRQAAAAPAAEAALETEVKEQPARAVEAPAPKGRFCIKCGAPLGEGQKFCQKCGAKVDNQ
ncbi:zinc ribbon domain-containing protein [Anaerotalea alkaliphila]|uniref:Zinc ribbon domain-containing protein n=1 Tax=Anaerotalea alkaliphila TaxID=2662126 RepID=A0A7X5KMG2_9FIRM|nr:zinc ribbon domain-containing protein [Anaerotalea alkaliphila]NDL67789.1 zinc ribbon domain-containing protein [Anaerotalea alkaliphila]